MEVNVAPLFLTLFFFIIFFLLKLIRTRFTTKNSTVARLPPGPWKLPFIGNLHQLIGSLPHRVLGDLAKKYGPIMHIQMGEISSIVFSSPEAVKEVMKTHDLNFASRPRFEALAAVTYDCSNMGFAPYGEYWKQLRKVCTTELFSARRVQSFRDLREEESTNSVKWIAGNEGSPVNFTEKIHSFTYGTISRAAFGKKRAEQETVISLVKEIIRLAEAFNVADLYPSLKFLHSVTGIKAKMESAHKELDRMFDNMINERRTERRTKDGENKLEDQKDLLDVLLMYHEQENLGFSPTIANIKGMIVDVFTAGTETTSGTVDWAMAEMMKNPEIMKKAQEEVRQVFGPKGYVDEGDFDKLRYMKSVIKETLRVHPPLPLLLPRLNQERCVINGYEIPANTHITVNAWAVNRDPSYWKDAESFQPERFLEENSSIDYKSSLNFDFIPFGGGRRVCAGMHLGVANMELPLAKFLYHFDWVLPNGMKSEELDMTEGPGFTLRRQQDLYLVPSLKYPLIH
ncbi:OLC1v1005775C1 [Oldenlandia corymbosa var. corymbosa]|uniref:OLC1v1005775C1 n=1 Tax=Oldenlandia corymbosa var. corymbosa TaxID=529605 RepID=A0AAV1DIU3_OLDCO|nr:OLC1v1005775C1 [Oldenlandia corymbosa var. corymbosa]